MLLYFDSKLFYLLKSSVQPGLNHQAATVLSLLPKTVVQTTEGDTIYNGDNIPTCSLLHREVDELNDTKQDFLEKLQTPTLENIK